MTKKQAGLTPAEVVEQATLEAHVVAEEAEESRVASELVSVRPESPVVPVGPVVESEPVPEAEPVKRSWWGGVKKQ